MQQYLQLDKLDFALFAEGLLFLLVGIALIRLALIPLLGLFFRRASVQVRLVVKKITWYGGLFFVLIASLSRMGVEVGGLLGAAGIAGVAVGIASQSSLSNIIAGLFLVSENAFSLGDVIKIETTTGVVYAVDLLAVRLRTFDNTLIRIPHQKLITSVVTNITRFPVRRMDFTLQMPYDSDLARVEAMLRRVVGQHPLALNNPEPFIMFTAFNDTGVEVLLGVWFEKTDFVKVRNGISTALLEAFRNEGIRIPFPHIEIINNPGES